MKLIKVFLLLALFLSGQAMAQDSTAKTVLGGGLGAALGTALGGVVGGKSGEVIGGAVGGGVGGAVTTKGEGQAGAVIGGAAGGAGGAYVGRKVSHSGTGAVVGAGLGGAGGAGIGKVIAEPSYTRRSDRSDYSDDDEHHHSQLTPNHNRRCQLPTRRIRHGPQLRRRPLVHRLQQIPHPQLIRRNDPLDQRPSTPRASRDQHLPIQPRRDGHHMRHLRQPRHQRPPVAYPIARRPHQVHMRR